MRPKMNFRKEVIAQFVTAYYEQHDRFPSEKNIVDATGIPAGSVHRYLNEMKESGEFVSDGGRRSTVRKKRSASSSTYTCRSAWWAKANASL